MAQPRDLVFIALACLAVVAGLASEIPMLAGLGVGYALASLRYLR